MPDDIRQALKPRQVLGVRTKSVDDGTVVLEWDANVDHYEVFVGEGEIPEDFKGDPVRGETATITGLPNGQPALFRVRAVSRVGTTGLFRGEWSAPHAAIPRAPIKPAKITSISSDPQEGAIVWTWDAPAGGGKLIIGYELEWKEVGEDVWSLVQGLAEASYTLATDGHESSYVVRVRAQGEEAFADWSDDSAAVSSLVVPDPAPQSHVITTSGTFTWPWSDATRAVLVLRSGTGGAGGGGGGGGGGFESYYSASTDGFSGGPGGGTGGAARVAGSAVGFSQRDGTGRRRRRRQHERSKRWPRG